MAKASTHQAEVATPRFRFHWGNVVVAVISVGAVVAVVLMTREDLPTINWVFVAGLVSISGLVLTVIGIYNGSLSKRLDTLESAMLKQGDRLQAEIQRQGDSLKAEIQRQGDRLDSLREDVQNLSHEVHGLGERVAGLEGRYGWPAPAGPVPAPTRIVGAP